MSLRNLAPARLGERPLPLYTGPVDAEMASRHPLRVLVADDNAVNRKVAALMLSRLGYAPDLAVTGREAIVRSEAQIYDVVFMDVHMPDVDGLDATRAINARAAGGPRPRIVALTGSTLDDERARCAEAGMDDHVPKPVSLKDIAAALAVTPRRVEV
jgi:CheY-like chemotaxis protein